MHGTKISPAEAARRRILAKDLETPPLAAVLELMRAARDIAGTLSVSDEISKQELLDALAIGELNAHRLLAEHETRGRR